MILKPLKLHFFHGTALVQLLDQKQIQSNMKVEKVAWVIGRNPVNQEKIRERGYAIREFKLRSGLQWDLDEQPDLIIFSESDIKDFTILSQIRDFFPDVIVLSLPKIAEQEEFITEPRHYSPLEESMGRLLSAIQRIENE
jgi:hypothetical protein